MKKSNAQSLRYQVDKWLAPASTAQVHVTAFSRTRREGKRYVCVETADGRRSVFLFRDADGNWSVFPPAADRSRFYR